MGASSIIKKSLIAKLSMRLFAGVRTFEDLISFLKGEQRFFKEKKIRENTRKMTLIFYDAFKRLKGRESNLFKVKELK